MSRRFLLLCSACRYNKENAVILVTGNRAKGLDPEALKDLIRDSLDADKAEDIEIINLTGQSALADYMVVATGRSSRQVGALAEKLQDRLKSAGVKDVKIEGKDLGNWVVLDAGDVIVHLFRPEVRGFYNIEKMWSMPHLMDASHGSGNSAPNRPV
ncbi:MAG: ribosome silencing factor [Rhodospirillales bacterium]|nr:ribosome silencing factor [Rhodospirillales bacterium]